MKTVWQGLPPRYFDFTLRLTVAAVTDAEAVDVVKDLLPSGSRLSVHETTPGVFELALDVTALGTTHGEAVRVAVSQLRPPAHGMLDASCELIQKAA